MPPIPAHDLTIVIPFRHDRPERAENLATVLAHLATTLDGAEVLVLEHGPRLTAAALAARHGARWWGTESAGPFHRTVMLNDGMLARATRPFAASYDTDTLVYPAAMAAALERLRGGAGYVLPFDGRFVNLAGAARAGLVARPDLTALPPDTLAPRRSGDVTLMAADSVGGVVMVRRAAFAEAGGYHEQFRAWGFEDAELAARMARFGHPPRRIEGFPLIHLDHPRGHRGAGWYAGSRANKVLAARMARLDRAALERLIAAGGLRADAPPPAPPTWREWLHALLS
ncbi:MAG: galactosyltransferase-related protein [Gemmobacter sp.]